MEPVSIDHKECRCGCGATDELGPSGWRKSHWLSMPENREKLSRAHKGVPLSESHRANMLAATQRPEAREKTRQALIGRPSWNKGRRWTPEERQKIAAGVLRLWEQLDYSQRMSAAHLGQKSWAKGKTADTDPRIAWGPKQSESLKRRYREGGLRPWNYNPDLEREYPLAFNSELKAHIRWLDFDRCCLCGSQSKSVTHHVDAIKANTFMENLATLCRKCHGIAHRRDSQHITKALHIWCIARVLIRIQWSLAFNTPWLLRED